MMEVDYAGVERIRPMQLSQAILQACNQGRVMHGPSRIATLSSQFSQFALPRRLASAEIDELALGNRLSPGGEVGLPLVPSIRQGDFGKSARHDIR